MPFPLTDQPCFHARREGAVVRPNPADVVHRDECAYCCRTCSEGDGIYVCMVCYMGLCYDHLAKHMEEYEKHEMFTVIKRLPAKETEEVRDVSYLGVVVVPEEYETAVCCVRCKEKFSHVADTLVETYNSIVNAPLPGAQESAAQGLMGRLQKHQCPHLVCLEQLANPFALRPPTSDDLCAFEGCGCHVNNWMCMTCGAIGCPRPEAGGSGHALQHYAQTGHPACVKLGTITPNGADFYCYACDDDVDDAHFAAHMAHFGIDIQTAKKTAQTMGELEYDYTSRFDFNKITEADVSLTPSYGPGRTGIKNIGNSCYLASVMQCLMSLGPFQDFFFPDGSTPHQDHCSKDPYECLHCQTERLAAGLLSGDFSKEGQQLTNGICPRLFKNAYALGHPEFSSGAQQDAHEYLLYVLEVMDRFVCLTPRTLHGGQQRIHPAETMKMVMEHRMQCSKCQRVRYTYEMNQCLSLPIPIDPEFAASVMAAAGNEKIPDAELDAIRPRCSLSDCLQAAFSSSSVEVRCEACLESAEYMTTTRVATFPDVLAVYVRRTYFDKATCNTKKMDAYVEAPQHLVLEAYRGSGLQPDEVPMPAHAASSAEGLILDGCDSTSSPFFDECTIQSMVDMGFDRTTSMYALRQACGNIEVAAEYIFSHENIVAEALADKSRREKEKQHLSQSKCNTTEAGIPKPATDGAASYELKAMISHMGASARTGHYVCHIKDAVTSKWLLFNDEKVGESQNPPFSLASLYFFQRKS
ncbi:hypothetical protein JKF63_00444 [Porcisia hertigi]|uniref:Ubiquitin carboxyl-terminal hydrolase n=1 Tax=Porcisia hertigi TaxID=2761500 RepID=A0A836KX55_9TRYP|nr:hypothetical protein JKF63_00444 [Porcisia hertigi]